MTDPGDTEPVYGGGAATLLLPWGAPRERGFFPESIPLNTNVKPGEFVLQTLFAQFVVLAERKIDLVLDTPVSSKLDNLHDLVSSILDTLVSPLLDTPCPVHC